MIKYSNQELVALGVEMRAAQNRYYRCNEQGTTRKNNLMNEAKLLEWKVDTALPKESNSVEVTLLIAARKAQVEYHATHWKDTRKANLLRTAKVAESAFDRMASNQPDPQGMLFT